jgi:type IV pilus assembly protein PilA
MVVMVIIGILAALASGSFLSYQARAKQSEAKVNLGAIGELALTHKAEFDTYVTDWTGIGWSPNMITRYRYWYNGIAAAGTPTNPEAGVSYADPGSAATANTFLAMTIGNIDRDVSTDQITYNQNRDLVVIQSDVSTP